MYIDKEKLKDTVNTLISNAKSEILLLIYLQNKYNHNIIKNLNLLFTNSNTNINNSKIRILFDSSYNLKLLRSTSSTNLLNIQYIKIDKPLRSDMIFL